MQVSIETIQNLRSEAINNIKRYCEASGEDFTAVKNAIYQEADQFNLKLPADFYIEVYNLSLTLKVN